MSDANRLMVEQLLQEMLRGRASTRQHSAHESAAGMVSTKLQQLGFSVEQVVPLQLLTVTIAAPAPARMLPLTLPLLLPFPLPASRYRYLLLPLPAIVTYPLLLALPLPSPLL